MTADLEYSEDTKICFDRNTLNIRCEEEEESDESVITSLSVTQFRNAVTSEYVPYDSINVNMQWETEILDLVSISTKLFEGSNVDGTNYKWGGQSRNGYVFGLKPKTNYLIRLEAILADGSKSVRLLEFRTRGL